MSRNPYVAAADMASASGWRAQQNAEWTALRLMARHLRREHGWGIRKINLELGMSDAEVKRACDE